MLYGSNPFGTSSEQSGSADDPTRRMPPPESVTQAPTVVLNEMLDLHSLTWSLSGVRAEFSNVVEGQPCVKFTSEGTGRSTTVTYEGQHQESGVGRWEVVTREPDSPTGQLQSHDVISAGLKDSVAHHIHSFLQSI